MVSNGRKGKRTDNQEKGKKEEGMEERYREVDKLWIRGQRQTDKENGEGQRETGKRVIIKG